MSAKRNIVATGTATLLLAGYLSMEVSWVPNTKKNSRVPQVDFGRDVASRAALDPAHGHPPFGTPPAGDLGHQPAPYPEDILPPSHPGTTSMPMPTPTPGNTAVPPPLSRSWLLPSPSGGSPSMTPLNSTLPTYDEDEARHGPRDTKKRTWWLSDKHASGIWRSVRRMTAVNSYKSGQAFDGLGWHAEGYIMFTAQYIRPAHPQYITQSPPTSAIVIAKMDGTVLGIRQVPARCWAPHLITPSSVYILCTMGDTKDDMKGNAKIQAGPPAPVWNITANSVHAVRAHTGSHDAVHNEANKSFFVLERAEGTLEVDGIHHVGLRTPGNCGDCKPPRAEWYITFEENIVERRATDGNVLWKFRAQLLFAYIMSGPWGDGFNTPFDAMHANSVMFDAEEQMLYVNCRHALCVPLACHSIPLNLLLAALLAPVIVHRQLHTFFAVKYPSGEVVWGAGKYGPFTLVDESGKRGDRLWSYSHGLQFWGRQDGVSLFTMFNNNRPDEVFTPDCLADPATCKKEDEQGKSGKNRRCPTGHHGYCPTEVQLLMLDHERKTLNISRVETLEGCLRLNQGGNMLPSQITAVQAKAHKPDIGALNDIEFGPDGSVVHHLVQTVYSTYHSVRLFTRPLVKIASDSGSSLTVHVPLTAQHCPVPWWPVCQNTLCPAVGLSHNSFPCQAVGTGTLTIWTSEPSSGTDAVSVGFSIPPRWGLAFFDVPGLHACTAYWVPPSLHKLDVD
eukprot:gene6211-150_t